MDNIVETFNCFEALNVYKALQDHLSKEIFEKRICYSYTGNYEYIVKLSSLVSSGERTSFGNIIRKNLFELYNNFERTLIREIQAYLNKQKGEKNVVICGAKSGQGAELAERLKKLKPILCDKIADTNIITTEDAVFQYPNALYIVASTNYYQTMINELIYLGIEEENIIVMYSSYHHMFKALEMFYAIYAERKEHQIEKYEYFVEDFINLTEDEVFLDCGFYDGNSTTKFMEYVNNKFCRIIAFEPDTLKYNEAKNNQAFNIVELYNFGCWSKKGEFCYKHRQGGAGFYTDDGDGDYISVDSIDNILKGDRATFIKMDIEGGELEALKGAEKTIRKYSPKMAISVYHKPLDIIDIPLYILSLNNNYKMYLRQYGTNETDTVLYCIP